MKRPSPTEYLYALKESKANEIYVSVCDVHSKKVMNKIVSYYKLIPLPTFLQSNNS